MQSRQRILARTFIAALVLAAALSACGQKGDLYLPDPEPENNEQAEGE